MIILIKKNLISEIKSFGKHHASVYLDKKCVNNGFAYVSQSQQYITTDFEQTLRSFFPNGKTVVPMVDQVVVRTQSFLGQRGRELWYQSRKKRTSSRWNQLTLGKCETIPCCAVFLIVSGVQPLFSNSIPKMWKRMKGKPDKPMRHFLKYIKNCLDFLDIADTAIGFLILSYIISRSETYHRI